MNKILQIVMAVLAINVVSASEQKIVSASASELPPPPKDNFVETMLEWRAWYRNLRKDVVPAAIKTVRIAGPFRQAFNAREKPLS
jgi:hypothetical protein